MRNDRIHFPRTLVLLLYIQIAIKQNTKLNAISDKNITTEHRLQTMQIFNTTLYKQTNKQNGTYMM